MGVVSKTGCGKPSLLYQLFFPETADLLKSKDLFSMVRGLQTTEVYHVGNVEINITPNGIFAATKNN